ncbi:MAG TPA: T9SS type A sorting domain-containing protein, partial [Niastella sp.]|nr:T9SS type A sorting domain-containing protein [Niastella sp.]
ANVLLSQTIALALNINITGNGLRSVILQNGYLTTITKSGSSCTAAAATCQNGGVISSKKITSNTALATLLNGKTVADLLTIASNALGGTLPSGVTYSDISSAVDVINNLFDGGRYSLGFFPCQKTCSNLTVACATSASITLSNRTSLETTEEIAKLSVSTYPNPYSNNVRFTVANPKAGQGSLEVFNMLGQKVKTVYQGFIPKGSQTYQMNGAALQHGNLIYRLHVGNTQVTGKLLHAKE